MRFSRTKPEDDVWRDKLTAEQYRVLRGKGTERPFSGEYVHTKDDGMYRCAACDGKSDVVDHLAGIDLEDQHTRR